MDPLHGDTGSKLVALAAMLLVVVCVSGTRLTRGKPSETARAHAKGHYAFARITTTSASPAYLPVDRAK